MRSELGVADNPHKCKENTLLLYSGVVLHALHTYGECANSRALFIYRNCEKATCNSPLS